MQNATESLPHLIQHLDNGIGVSAADKEITIIEKEEL